MMSTQHIHCDLDFDSDGKRSGNLNLSFSSNEHAFNNIAIPIVVIKNGPGPTLLLSAGTHGDEYEGQIILRRMIHNLAATDIKGRLIILPALNYPAVINNTRISPLDQGNLNRCFPGNENSGPTSAIAHFVTNKLLPMADAGVDLHSGGSGTYYAPSAYLCRSKNRPVMQKSLALAEAFNAPYTLLVEGSDSSGGFDPTAHDANIPFISAELSGGANLDMNATKIGMTGINNILIHMGMLSGDVTSCSTTCLNGIDGSYSVSVPYSGIFDPCFALGDVVRSGQTAGFLHSMEEIERDPLNITFEADGIIFVRRNSARVIRGSHVFSVAQPVDPSTFAGLMKANIDL